MKKFALTAIIATSIIGFTASSAHASYGLDIRENNLQMKLNRVEFAQQYYGTVSDTVASLTDEQVQELQDIYANFTTDMKQFEGSAASATNLAELEEVYAEMKEVLAQYYGMVLYVVSGNDAATALVEDRYALFQTNEELREENRKTMSEYLHSLEETFEELGV